jgi:holo-[acyl-carrier protein] synthase
MIVGVGVDIVDVRRFSATLARTPRVVQRLFTDAERASVRDDPTRLAARFAAKEALAKALGAPGGLRWHDAEVVREESGRPRLTLTGTVAQAAVRSGIRSWQVSLSHDAGMAVAMVVGESEQPA